MRWVFIIETWYYWRLPDEDELLAWAELGLAAARRAKRKTPAKRKHRS